MFDSMEQNNNPVTMIFDGGCLTVTLNKHLNKSQCRAFGIALYAIRAVKLVEVDKITERSENTVFSVWFKPFAARDFHLHRAAIFDASCKFMTELQPDMVTLTLF